jgi:hypothetical protein
MYKIALVLLLCVSSKCLLAQTNRDTISNSFVKTNPYKPFLGIVSIGYENIVYKRFSLSVFAEYMVRDSLLIGGDREHPVFVFQMTPRFYFNDQKILSGLFLGAITGFTLKRKNTNQVQGIIVGVESGYKILLGKKQRFFIEPKVLLTHNFSGEKTLIPGVEVHVGFRL